MDSPLTQPTTIRVLIVDDHDMLREGLSTSLAIFRDVELVGEAANGVEAVRLCQELTPDIILMDLMMPEMDGIKAIEKIHETYPDIKIIVLSSFAEDNLTQAALNAGAVNSLLKNISANKLVETIRTTIKL